MLEKFDVHVHVAHERLDVPFGNPMDPASHYICDPQEMRQTLSAQNIGKALLMSSGEEPRENIHSLGCYNRDCIEIVRADPEHFGWMCGIDPVDPETVESRLSDWKQQGAVGVGEVMVNERLDSTYMKALFAAAQKLDMPVLCHMSPEEGFSYGVVDLPGLPLLEKTLREFPNLKFIGHSQVFWMEISGDCPKSGSVQRNGFGHGPVQPGGAVVRLMQTYPNLYADLSAFSGSCAITRDRDFGIWFLETFRDRLLFGTDTLNQRTVFPLGKYLDTLVQDGLLSGEAYEKICRKNAQRLFGI